MYYDFLEEFKSYMAIMFCLLCKHTVNYNNSNIYFNWSFKQKTPKREAFSSSEISNQ